MAKNDKYNLTEGGILQKLLLVSLPIIGTQVIQMAYNLTDMFWLGRVGSTAVAASSSVGMYMWLSLAFIFFGSRGAEIGVSQNIGRGDRETAQSYGQNAVTLSLLLGLTAGAVFIVFRRGLIGFFQIIDPSVITMAESYLSIIGIGMPFAFVSAAITGIFNGSGNSRLPFIINACGLVTNMILDPVLILRYNQGVRGAAVATIIAQMLCCVLMVIALLKSHSRPFEQFRFLAKPEREKVVQITKWVLPIAVESFLFCFLSMILSRFVASFGSDAMAASRVSSQVESLSWLIGGGYSIALTSFVGQNFGAKKWDRIHRGFRISFGVMVVWGFAITAIMYLGAPFFMELFVPGNRAVAEIGIGYLHILAYSQTLACLEGIAAGSFRGTGRTIPPSVASITVNALRVVAAYFLVTHTALGLRGIWWSVAVGGAVRGLWIFLWYVIDKRKNDKNRAQTTDTVSEQQQLAERLAEDPEKI